MSESQDVADAVATGLNVVIADLQAENARVQGALTRYAQAVEDVWPYVAHLETCRRITTEFRQPEDCDCGLQAALDEGRVREARQAALSAGSFPSRPRPTSEPAT